LIFLLEPQDPLDPSDLQDPLDPLVNQDLPDPLGPLDLSDPLDLQALVELVAAIFAPMLLLVMSQEFWSSIIPEDKPKSSLVLDRKEA
jgi:hypothetical protein